ncbi:metal ABC transporter permease [Leucobacter denitrificans]|uniref:Metal ABC transporter permease n=1 Tax=Leucobacter denitrificans TaxID=683042 RepID=A0A7G9S329_9MICO|nr:metal ABC transporter permease [Leucobacter denitrificans]QNN62254.1 metal ABC transporter permease [Leucobacter denitrificans]
MIDVGVFAMFSLPFMMRALIAIAILSVAAGAVGVFINFRELEFVSDGLVHAVFPGLVIGMLVGGSAGLLPGAVIAAVIAAALFAFLGRTGGSGRDAGIAVTLTGLFSLGVVIVSRSESYVSQLQELLFGRILTVTVAQLWQIAVVALAALVIIWCARRALLFRSFDPAGFENAGFNAFRTDLALNVAVALLVVAGVQALGVLMVIAILVLPVAIARLLSRALWSLMPIATLIMFGAGVAGLWASFEWSVSGRVSASPGALIVLILISAYIVGVGISFAVGRLGRKPMCERR